MDTLELIKNYENIITPNRSMDYRVRFAPSPTGSPHVGNIRSAIYNWLFAHHHNGSFILRIEDTDRQRYNDQSLEDIMNALRMLDLHWDEGPETGGNFGPYFQSERLELYHKAAQWLVDNGFAYYCNCTAERLDEIRKKQKAEKHRTAYDRFCRNKGIEGKIGDGNCVIRFKVPFTGATEVYDELRGKISISNSMMEDFIIIKSDGWPTYHLANIVDDHLMKITYVLRAEEWIPSLGKHILLYKAF